MSKQEVLHVATEDGWQLGLVHWPKHSSKNNHSGAGRRFPVLMVHGLAANRVNLDLSERYSIARAVSDAGFDVFVLEMRGAGHSKPPHGFDGSVFSWGFGEHHTLDIPAAINFVCHRMGVQRIHGLGHSMGGMALLAHATSASDAFASIVGVASPMISKLKLGRAEARLLKLLTAVGPKRLHGRVPLRRVLGVVSPLVPIGSRLVDGLLLNLGNTSQEAVTTMANDGIDDVPYQLLIEISRHLARPDPNGPYAYERRLKNVRAPTFMIGGAADRVAPPASVRAYLSELGSRDLRYREMGVLFGDSADYGHADLLIGKHAPEEVYPMIIDFLDDADRAIEDDA